VKPLRRRLTLVVGEGHGSAERALRSLFPDVKARRPAARRPGAPACRCTRTSVNTLDKARADILFVDRTRVVLAEHTLVIIYGTAKKTAVAKTPPTVELDSGELQAGLAALRGKPVEVALQGGRVTAKSRDTSVRAKDKRATVSVFDGTASVASADKKVEVPQNHGTAFVRDKRQSPRRCPGAQVAGRLRRHVAGAPGERRRRRLGSLSTRRAYRSSWRDAGFSELIARRSAGDVARSGGGLPRAHTTCGSRRGHRRFSGSPPRPGVVLADARLEAAPAAWDRRHRGEPVCDSRAVGFEGSSFARRSLSEGAPHRPAQARSNLSAHARQPTPAIATASGVARRAAPEADAAVASALGSKAWTCMANAGRALRGKWRREPRAEGRVGRDLRRVRGANVHVVDSRGRAFAEVTPVRRQSGRALRRPGWPGRAGPALCRSNACGRRCPEWRGLRPRVPRTVLGSRPAPAASARWLVDP
jgi:hypothetical protein